MPMLRHGASSGKAASARKRPCSRTDGRGLSVVQASRRTGRRGSTVCTGTGTPNLQFQARGGGQAGWVNETSTRPMTRNEIVKK